MRSKTYVSITEKTEDLKEFWGKPKYPKGVPTKPEKIDLKYYKNRPTDEQIRNSKVAATFPQMMSETISYLRSFYYDVQKEEAMPENKRAQVLKVLKDIMSDIVEIDHRLSSYYGVESIVSKVSNLGINRIKKMAKQWRK